jgi:glutathione S-transferase
MENDMKNVKVEYFGINGKGAVTRALLWCNNVPFEDVRITFEDWGSKLKKSGNYEFEQLPAFEYNGKRMFQSGAISTFLARKFNLLGKNLDEEYLHSSLLWSIEDALPKFIPAYFATSPEGQTQIPEKRKEWLEVHAPHFLKIWEKRFNAHAGKYCVGDSFGLSDVVMTVMLTNLFKNGSRKDGESVLNENAPKLSKHINNIAKNELATFFEKGWIHDSLI